MWQFLSLVSCVNHDKLIKDAKWKYAKRLTTKRVTLLHLYHVNCWDTHKKLSIAKLDFVQVCGLSLNFYNKLVLEIQRQSADLNKSNFAIGGLTNQQTISPASNAQKSVLPLRISISRIIVTTGKNEKEYSWHVPAITFIGMKPLF